MRKGQALLEAAGFFTWCGIAHCGSAHHGLSQVNAARQCSVSTNPLGDVPSGWSCPKKLDEVLQAEEHQTLPAS
jgi:hypothetical protein